MITGPGIRYSAIEYMGDGEMKKLQAKSDDFKKHIEEAKRNERLNPGGLRFTDKERDDLYKALGKYKKEKPDEMEEFIFEVEKCCTIISADKKRRSRSIIKADEEPMINSFRKTLKHLKNIQKKRRSLKYPYNITNLTDELNYIRKFTTFPKSLENFSDQLKKGYDFIDDFRNTARQATELLEHLIDLFESNLNKPPNVKKILATLIAKSFKTNLDKPTGYKDGPFFNTVIIAFEALGFKNEDPSNAIKAALAEIRKPAI